MDTTERLGAPPAGAVIDVSNVSELEIGDKIHITFPGMSLGRIAYGPETVLTVAGKTHDGKVVLADPSGKTMAPIGGSKGDLLKMLSEKTSYDTVTVIRPPEVQARIMAARGDAPSKIALVGLREIPLASLWTADPAGLTLRYDSAAGGVIFKVASRAGEVVTTQLTATDDPARQVQIGKTFTFSKADLPASVWKLYEKPAPVPETIVAAIGVPWIPIAIGALAVGGIAAVIYLRKRE